MSDLVTASAIMAAFAGGAAKKAGELSFSALMGKLNSTLVNLAPAGIKKELTEALTKYEKQTFDRCIKVKTLINRDTPVDILSIYVPVRFRNNGQIIDQYDLIENLNSTGRIVISGTGGSGKSMFMRYLWLSLFENGHGKVPIFLELRNWNDISIDDFLVFIFNSVFSGVNNSDGLPVFQNMLEEGRFAFILDGFDEVSEEKKKQLTKQILSLSIRFSGNIFAVSTRPLDFVTGWNNFSTYHVAPMTKDDVLLLVRKIEFPNKVKLKFSQAVRGHLFKSHKTFLEIPLLATIMLFLFNEIADIPNDMHVFYDQAFWTLFRRHDASKDAFDRKLNCGLTMDQFRSAVASFCFFSYIGGKLNLSDTEISQFIVQSSDFLKIEIDVDSFKKDLINNICFLQLDGIDYIFIHRSFQEYFSAVFVSSRPESEWLEAALILPSSPTESAIKILYSMNREKFDSAILFNIIDTLNISLKKPIEFWNRIIELEGLGPQASIFVTVRAGKADPSKLFMFLSMFHSRIYRFLVYYNNRCRTLDELIYYPSTTFNIGSARRKISSFLKSRIKELRSPDPDDDDIFFEEEITLGSFSSHIAFQQHHSIPLNDLELTEELTNFVLASKSYRDFINVCSALCSLLNEISKERAARKSFSNLIGRSPIFLK